MPLLEASRVVSWPHTIGLIAPWANTFAQGDFRSWPQRRGIQVLSDRASQLLLRRAAEP